MKIKKVDDHLLHISPRDYIQKRVLPIDVRCEHCKSIISLDMTSDIFAARRREYSSQPKWGLEVTCLVCHENAALPAPSDYAYRTEKPNAYYGNYKHILKYYVNEIPPFCRWSFEHPEAWHVILFVWIAINSIFVIPFFLTSLLAGIVFLLVSVLPNALFYWKGLHPQLRQKITTKASRPLAKKSVARYAIEELSSENR